MKNIAELTLVINNINEKQYSEIIEDLKEENINFIPVGYIEQIGIFTITSVIMPSQEYCVQYINSLDNIISKWSEYNPYFDEGGIV